MRWVIFGAGAVGGVVGARLFGAGQDVLLVARGAHLAAIQRDGLLVRSPAGEQRYHIPATAAAGAELRAGDVLVLGMKSMDTVAALAELSRTADPEIFGGSGATVDAAAAAGFGSPVCSGTPADSGSLAGAGSPARSGIPVLCLQNGVANEAAALRLFANVYGVCVLLPASHLEPGVVVQHNAPVPGILDVGRYPHGLDTTATELAGVLRSAGFDAQPRAEIMPWKYAKLVSNLANAVEALCGQVEGLGEAVRPVREEGAAVLRAAGIDVTSADEFAARRGDMLSMAGVHRGGGSTWQSLARGTGSVEADYLNGEIVLLGRLHGVPTPANETARRLVERCAREGTPPGSLTPEQFLAALR